MIEDPTPAQAARRDIMLTLVEAYEAEHHQIDASSVSPLDVLKSLMDEHGMNASDLGRVLGNRALGSLILNGKRQLSKTHIKKKWPGILASRQRCLSNELARRPVS